MYPGRAANKINILGGTNKSIQNSGNQLATMLMLGMSDRSARRRAALLRQRANDIAIQLGHVRDAADRRHLLELAETFKRAADEMEPPRLCREPRGSDGGFQSAGAEDMKATLSTALLNCSRVSSVDRIWKTDSDRYGAAQLRIHMPRGLQRRSAPHATAYE